MRSFILSKKYKFTIDKPKDFYIKELKGVFFRNRWCAITDGFLLVNHGYAWDGCTFAPDTHRTYLPSLVHDLLYQFQIVERERADYVFFMMLKRAWFKYATLYYVGVLIFGKKHYFC